MAVLYLTQAEAAAVGQCPPSPTTATTAAVTPTTKLCDTFLGDQIDSSASTSLWNTAGLALLSPLPARNPAAACYAAPAPTATCGQFADNKTSGRFAFDATSDLGSNAKARRLETRKLNCTHLGGCQMRAWLRMGWSGADKCDQFDYGDELYLEEVGNGVDASGGTMGRLNTWNWRTTSLLYGGAWKETTSSVVFGSEVVFRFQQAGGFYIPGKDNWAIANVCVLVGGNVTGNDAGCTCPANTPTPTPTSPSGGGSGTTSPTPSPSSGGSTTTGTTTTGTTTTGTATTGTTTGSSSGTSSGATSTGSTSGSTSTGSTSGSSSGATTTGTADKAKADADKAAADNTAADKIAANKAAADQAMAAKAFADQAAAAAKAKADASGSAADIAAAAAAKAIASAAAAAAKAAAEIVQMDIDAAISGGDGVNGVGGSGGVIAAVVVVLLLLLAAGVGGGAGWHYKQSGKICFFYEPGGGGGGGGGNGAGTPAKRAQVVVSDSVPWADRPAQGGANSTSSAAASALPMAHEVDGHEYHKSVDNPMRKSGVLSS